MKNKGTAKVIVRLTAPPSLAKGFALEGTLKTAESVDKQRVGIAQVQDKVVSILSKSHGAAAKRFDFIPFMALEVDQSEFSALAASSDIDLIEEDIPVPPTLYQSVPLIGAVSGAFNGYAGSGQTVAILDTGVDKTHPFLTGKVVSEACYSTTYAPGSATSVCTSGSTAAGSGLNCASGVSGCDHGTHVAGIVAGNGGTFSGNPFSGVAKDATIIAIQVFSRIDNATTCGAVSTPCVLSYTSDQIRALNRVYDLRSTYNISSVNMSLGSGSFTANCDINANYSAEKTAIDTLRSVGIATVIASGNNSYTTSISGPACISTAISVGATDKSDVVASYSNSASILNLLAPGSSIYSSIPGANYANFYGTSMATPHVAGAWAVLKSAKPTATVSEILNALTSTGKSITDARNSIVKPRIRLDAAVNTFTGGTINGVCGNSNNQAYAAVSEITNLCSAGTPSTVSLSAPWRWSCGGVNGGMTANCLAYSLSQQVSVSPFPQNFDSVITPALPSGWTSSGSNDPSTGVWQTNIGTHSPGLPESGTVGASAHSGSNLVYFNSYDVNTGMMALLSSPAFSLEGKSGAKASFWMYRDQYYLSGPPQNIADLVYVYVNTAPNVSDGNQNLLGIINRYINLPPVVSSAGWYQYTFDIPATFTGPINHLLLNGVSDFGYDIHLDDITVYAFSPAYYLLGFNFAGTGYGSVTSSPAGISCTGTTGSGCAPNYFTSGPVTLTAVRDSSSSHNSTFTGWTPACGTNPCAVTISGPATVTGTFSREKLVKISPTAVSYGSIFEAYTAAATSGQTIQVRENSLLTPFADPLTIVKSLTLIGGFNSLFSTGIGYTTTNGPLRVAPGGVLKVQRIIIK
jgi:subtilisin family serine protease